MAFVPFSEDAIVPDVIARSRPAVDVAQTWAQRFKRFAASNHTVIAFCAAEGVSESNFYLWKRRFAKPKSPSTTATPMIVPLRIGPAPDAHIELAMPSGNVLRFPADTRPELLVAVLRGLEAQPC
jgi:transposase